MPRQPFDERINTWLRENAGQQFTRNKWRFWFFPLAGFQFLNSFLTALTFRAGGELENAMGAVMLGVGALLVWVSVAFIFYSDSTDRRLARGVSLLDSVTLICVLTHFTFLLWTFGHLRTVQSAERKYDAQVEKFNQDARGVQDGNVRIAESAERIAQANERAEKLKNDAAYQLRKAAESGARIVVPRSASESGVAPGLATSQIQLTAPVKPEESSAAFLARWDMWIRIANLAELILAAATLIYIRNRSAKTNSPVEKMVPMGTEFSTVRTPVARPAFSTTRNDTVSLQNVAHNETTQDDTATLKQGLKVLRETLRDIAFYTPGVHYKADLKPDCVWIRQMTSDSGVQRTAHGEKAKHSILRSALRMEPERFRAQVEAWLGEHGFFEDREEN